MEYKKKLIEVALPLEAINAASVREKSIRHGHPSTLHLWWARRPLATARAVIFSSLVDDPSSHPEQFPTEEEQEAERKRLFDLIEELVKWENTNNKEILNKAKAEIMKSTDGNPPALLDPFAGGGTIPLEAQRLGLEAHASDLNPVAVMINKAMIEIPPRFAGQPPVNPESRRLMNDVWAGTTGLAEDVRYYGEWMKEEAFKRIGHLYPKVKVPKELGGGEATVIAWIWARTVKCPNPACGCEMPLIRSFVLSKKAGKETYVEPITENGKVTYEINYGKKAPDGTVKRTGAHCLFCKQPINFDYIRSEAQNNRMHEQLVSIIAEGKNGRIFIAPDLEQIDIAKMEKPTDCPNTDLPEKALGFRVQAYGIKRHEDLFTSRQLKVLSTLSELVYKTAIQVEKDAVNVGMKNDYLSLCQNGKGTKAYAEAIAVYLGFLVDQVANHSSTICSWNSPNTQMRNTFARQAIPMVWDFAECNVFSNSSGSYNNLHERLCKAFVALGSFPEGNARQNNAQNNMGYTNIMVSTDPPYYDNIGYADLSDFFYVWMRKSLKDIFPELFNTVLVPKKEELIASPFRFDGNMDSARDFFENGMYLVFERINEYTSKDIPVTIYYAFKQSEENEEDFEVESTAKQSASTGWETMLSAINRAGFSITGTWPMSTEKVGRTRDITSNALASSIVLVCRKRSADAPICTRRDFINALKRR